MSENVDMIITTGELDELGVEILGENHDVVGAVTARGPGPQV